MGQEMATATATSIGLEAAVDAPERDSTANARADYLNMIRRHHV